MGMRERDRAGGEERERERKREFISSKLERFVERERENLLAPSSKVLENVLCS
jgi:hypothetical protein